MLRASLRSIVCVVGLLMCSSSLSEDSSRALGLPQKILSDQLYLVELGQALFFDKNLSGDGSTSCASCHQPELGFADRRRFSQGQRGALGRRNSPTIVNAGYLRVFGWEANAHSLEEIIRKALLDPTEMGSSPSRSKDSLKRLGGVSKQDPIVHVVQALAAFTRVIVMADSKADRFLFANEPTAMNDTEINGLELFFGKAHCSVCHTIRHTKSHPFGGNSGLFTDQRLHNLGLVVANGDATNKWPLVSDFRTPTLRNIALTSPYMHDGRFKTLEEVIDFYDQGGGDGPGKDPIMRALSLTADEKMELVEFLRALTGRCGVSKILREYCTGQTVDMKEATHD